MNTLTYSIAGEFLEGSVEAERFSLRAFSGGGRGRKGTGAEHSLSSYDFFRQEKDTSSGHIHGGPIPPGFYFCQYVPSHPKFHECIELVQTITSVIQVDGAGLRSVDRDGFYIHGSGPHGSDGCIVIPKDTEDDRLRLNIAVKNAQSTVMVRVVEPGMPLPAVRETAGRLA